MNQNKMQATIDELCNWIIDKTKNGASSEELNALPEIAKATATLMSTAALISTRKN